MATIHCKGIDDYLTALAKLGDRMPEVQEDMCNKGAEIVARKLKAASGKFSKYVKLKKARHNQHGFYAQVLFKGKTSSGASASLAVNVYEHGRDSYHPQPARPFVSSTVAACEEEVTQAMQEVYEKAVKGFD